MAIAYLSLGSNLGDRFKNLSDALRRLSELWKIKNSSSIYETHAWGGIEQPDYLNACVSAEICDEITPVEILKTIKNFERELGRIESVRWGARKIDIDILLIDDEIYHSEELNIPHIMLPERLFVLVPLKDILPDDWKHPENGKSINELINAVDDDMPVVFGEL